MGSVNASDISEEQRMWTDIWNWRKKYYIPEKEDSWWQDFVNEGIDLGEKYGTSLCQNIIFAILDDVNERSKKGYD